MTTIAIIPAQASHIPLIAAHMRAADVTECHALGHAPAEALEGSLSASTMAWTGLVDDLPVAMFGVATPSLLDTSTGIPWMLGTNAVDRHAQAILRRNKAYVARMSAAFPRMENYVDARNVTSIKWLNWLGFTIEPVVPHGPYGLPFHKFHMRRRVPVTVRKCSVAEIEANDAFSSLWREYSAEAAIAGFPPPTEKLATYRLIETSGAFHAYGAFLAKRLVGFMAVLTPVIPHYGIAIAVTESLFVGSEHRKTGAGIKLIRTAERHAREAGSPGLLISAPMGGRLADVLPRLGYRETNRVFMKEVGHG